MAPWRSTRATTIAISGCGITIFPRSSRTTSSHRRLRTRPFRVSSATRNTSGKLTTITCYDPRLYALFGVRFVITGRPLAGLSPTTSLVVAPEAPLPGVSTAGYWSTRPMQASSARQAMRWLASEKTSDADAAIYEPAVPGLVPGGSSEIRVFRDRLVVIAESAGTSLLVLPVEFSHCWDMSLAGGSNGRLLRANVNQAGLLFSGRTKVELRYLFSPWHFRCRFRDIADARMLDVADVGWPE
jgi:hypothetical protein